MQNSLMMEFPLEEYRSRVDKLIAGMQRCGMDAVILSTKENARYFSGLQSIVWDSKITVPGVLVITAQGDMTVISTASNQATVKVTSVFDPDSLIAYSRGASIDTVSKAIQYALERYHVLGGRIGMEIGVGFRLLLTYRDQQELFTLLASSEVLDASPLLWEIRRIKSPLELEFLRRVCQINVDAYRKGFESIVCGKTTEEQLNQTMAAECYRLGAEGMLPLGIRCGLERYPQGNCPPSRRVIGLQEGEMLLVDGGPCYRGYYSDIIREAVTGKPTDRQRMIYDIAVEGSALGLSHIKPGVPLKEICNLIDGFFASKGMEPCNRYKGWCGHGLGLDFHEQPTVSADCDVVLEPGMVMALEPELFDATCGVFGVEQNFVVTETGCEVLTPAPTELLCLPM